MKKTINFTDFCDAFKKMERETQLSYNGKRALFDFLEQIEAETGESIELDVIALSCDFAEFKNIEEFQKEYGAEYETMEDIEKRTIVIPLDDIPAQHGFIVQL